MLIFIPIFIDFFIDFGMVLGPKIHDFGLQNQVQEDKKKTRSNRTKIAKKYKKNLRFFILFRGSEGSRIDGRSIKII